MSLLKDTLRICTFVKINNTTLSPVPKFEPPYEELLFWQIIINLPKL